MTSHREIKAMLAVPNGRSAEEEAELREHLVDCESCRASAQDYARQDAIIRQIENPASPQMVSEVLRRVEARRVRSRIRMPAARSIGSAGLSLLAAAVLVIAVLGHDFRPRARHFGGATTPKVSAAARRLAHRLGIPGTPIIGNQREGWGRPWYVWLPAGFADGRPALFTSSHGAQGEFHYFALGPIAGHRADHFDGAVYRNQSVAVAEHWLQSVGVRRHGDVSRVLMRWRTTIIGGTGLCCYSRIDVVLWGGKSWDTASTAVYVADGRTVVQADVDRRLTAQLACVPHGRIVRGVPIGVSCFSYAQAAGGQMALSLGGHQPLLADPAWMASTFRFGTPTREQALPTPYRAPGAVQGGRYRRTYTFRYPKQTYLVTVVAAFPGLKGSVWEVAQVRTG